MSCARCGKQADVEWTYLGSPAEGLGECDELDLCAQCRDALARQFDVGALIDRLSACNQEMITIQSRLFFSDDERGRFWSSLRDEEAGAAALCVLKRRTTTLEH